MLNSAVGVQCVSKFPYPAIGEGANRGARGARAPQNGITMLEVCAVARSLATSDENAQGATTLQPPQMVGPAALPMSRLLFRYQIAVWRVLEL